jgi:hypothetical protein
MPPDNLLQFLQSQMETTQAVSTGVAHDEINKMIYKDDMRPTTLKFIQNAIAATKDTKAEDTSYGQAIAQLVKEYGNPFLKQQEWTDRKQNIAHFKPDSRSYDAPDWPVDTILTQPGNVRNLISELAHQDQLTPSEPIRSRVAKSQDDLILLQKMDMSEMRRDVSRRAYRENVKYGTPEVYHKPGTVEHEAHSVIRPTVQKRFETLLDSLSAPILAESLFQNQQ